MIPLPVISITIIIQDWDYGGAGESIREWAEQYPPLELHLQWRKKRSENHLAML
jgi:hypothetical protein